MKTIKIKCTPPLELDEITAAGYACKILFKFTEERKGIYTFTNASFDCQVKETEKSIIFDFFSPGGSCDNTP